MPPWWKKDHHFARCGCSGHRAVWVDGDHPLEWPCPPGVPGAGAGPTGAATDGCGADQERARERAARRRAAGGGASNRPAGDRLRGRQRRRYSGVGPGPGLRDWTPDRPAEAVARSSHWRPGGGGGSGPASGPRSMGLRDGRRPSASARAGGGASRTGRVAGARRCGGQPLLRSGRHREFRLGARDGVSVDHDGGAAALPTPPAERHRSDERLLPCATRRARPRPAPPARVQDPARAPRPAPGSARRGGVVHVRRAPVRAKQGRHTRGRSLPLAPGEAALRALRGRGAFGARREHRGPGVPHGLRGPLLCGLRDLRHPGLHALELLASPSSGCSQIGQRGAGGALAWPSSS